MSITDPVADLIVALKNSSVTRRAEMVTAFSNFKIDILKVLKKEGFIEDYTAQNEGKKGNIVVKLRYYGAEPAIKDAKKISKVSKRIYVSKDEMPPKAGNRVWIISTSKGVMTADDSREKGMGGELLFYVE